MGKNNGNSWLNAVKKAFRSPVNDDEKRTTKRREVDEHVEQDDKKRGKKRWTFRRHFSFETTIQHNIAKCTNSSAVSVCSGEENLVRKQPKMDDCASEQRRAIAVAMATTAAAEAAVATAQAAVEIIRLTKPTLLVKQHKAVVFIQTIFRGYLARKALMALKGVVKLQALIRGYNVRKRAKMTLQCIQSLVRVQALVCDQRRRLSCDGMGMIGHESSGRKSNSRNVSKASINMDVNPSQLQEIHALIQKAKECSLKQGKSLAHAFSHQVWTMDKDQFSDNHTEEDRFSDKNTIHTGLRKDGNLCNQRDPIKNVEVDTTRPYSYKTRDQYLDSMFISSPLYGKRLSLSVQSPKTPSPSKTKSVSRSTYSETEERKYRTAETPTSRAIYLHRMSVSDNSSCPLPRPNYMAATASAMARVRPHSTPRVRPSSPSPSRDQTGSARKRLSFPVLDDQRCGEACYGTE